MTTYAKAGASLLLIVLACLALFGAYHHGETLADAQWQAKWNQRDADDAQARAKAEADARTQERQREQSAEKVQRDATQKLEQARTDADGANAAADRLREQVRKLLGAGEAGRNPSAAPQPHASNQPRQSACHRARSICHAKSRAGSNR